MLKLLYHLLLLNSSKKHLQASKGFTLTELLVVLIIGSLIVSTLMLLVVELVGTEQRESARTETQREMQLALDYINNDLRQAVYIYDGDNHPFTGDNPRYLPFLPQELSTAQVNGEPEFRPVIAFWQPQPIDPAEAGIPTFSDAPTPPGGSCGATFAANPARVTECNNLWLQRRAYQLVAYFEAVNEDDDPRWRGQSRIVRYVLPKYLNVTNFARNPGFVDPAELGAGGFDNWPFVGDAANNGNCQTGGNAACPDVVPGAPAANPATAASSDRLDTLVDFVDSSNPADARTGQPDQCPAGFDQSPPRTAENPFPSFFACIRNDGTNGTGVFRDVRVYLRGNANGRGGVATDSFLPTLESRTALRGVIDAN